MCGVVGGSSYVASVTDTVCRVVVHAAGGADSTDLSLPGGCPVGVLLPSIVDLVLGAHERPPGPTHWVLTRPGGSALESSITLPDNGIYDGDLLVLTDVPPPPPRLVPGDPIGAVSSGAHSGTPGPAPVAAAVLAGLLLFAAVLTWAGRTAHTDSALWVSAALSGASAVTAAAAQRVPILLRTVLCAGAVIHAAVTGALAGAGASWPVTLALAAGAALAMAVTLTRVTTGAEVVLAGLAAAAGAILLAAMVALLTGCGRDAAGALLTVGSVAAVSAAPTVTVMVGGLGPARASPDTERVQTAHRLLTGLVLGWAVTTATGVAFAVSDRSVGTSVSVAFAAVVAALLFLRQRVHCVSIRRTGLATAGLAAAAAGVVAGVATAPETAGWWCGSTAVAAAAGLWIWLRNGSPSPLMHRAINVVEYVALTAVIPLAVWVAGGYDLAGGLRWP